MVLVNGRMLLNHDPWRRGVHSLEERGGAVTIPPSLHHAHTHQLTERISQLCTRKRKHTYTAGGRGGYMGLNNAHLVFYLMPFQHAWTDHTLAKR